MAIHPTAIVSPKAEIGNNVEIGPYTVIEDDVKIGDDCYIDAHVKIGQYTTIGPRCRIYFGVYIGEPQDHRFTPGTVAWTTVGADTTIREYVTIHRSPFAERYTRIGSGTLRYTLDACKSAILPAIGIHPHEADSFQEGDIERLRQLAPQALALGEIGLDFHYNFSPPGRQLEVLEAQLELAHSLNLPLILHLREADGEAYPLLKRWGLPPAGGVVHCFSSDWEAARRYLVPDRFYIAVAGDREKIPELSLPR